MQALFCNHVAKVLVYFCSKTKGYARNFEFD